MIVILDPSIYELTDCEINSPYRNSVEIQHIKFMHSILDVLEHYVIFDVQLHITLHQQWRLCNLSGHPWNQYKNLTNRNMIINAYAKFSKLKPYIEKNISNNEYTPCDHMNESSVSKAFQEFCKHLPVSYSFKNTFVFYGRLNNLKKKEVEYKCGEDSFAITPIYNTEEAFNDSLRKLLLLDTKYQTKPSVDNPLPNVDICKKYIQLRDADILNGEDAISTRIKYATEVALRNNYYVDTNLISINKGKHIFTHSKNHNIHLSIDILHGNLEVYNAFGKHQDEYSYDNKPQNKQDKTGKHDINV